ncbi:MAG: hypothetical protein ACKVOU_09565 [Cytophagales bacterium]
MGSLCRATKPCLSLREAVVGLQNLACRYGKPLKGFKILPVATGSLCRATKSCLSLREAFEGLQNLACHSAKPLKGYKTLPDT